jgi:hypothetical protein
MPKCHATSLTTGNKCRNRAMHGVIYCVCHGGNHQCQAATIKMTQCHRYGKHNGYCWQYKSLTKKDADANALYNEMIKTLSDIETYLYQKYSSKPSNILKKIARSVYGI